MIIQPLSGFNLDGFNLRLKLCTDNSVHSVDKQDALQVVPLVLNGTGKKAATQAWHLLTPKQISDGSAILARPSAKMRKLLECLKSDFAAGKKVLVFSQWTCFLNLLQRYLLDSSETGLEAGQVRSLDGSLNRKQRAACVAWLEEEGEKPKEGEKKRTTSSSRD